MKYSIDNELKNGLSKSIYLLYGDERYLLNNYTNKLINYLVPNKDDVDTELTIFDGDKANVINIIDACEMISFTGGKRIVIVKYSNLLYKAKVEQTDMLTKFVNDSEDDFTLIFIENNVDKRSKLYKAIAKKGFVEEYTNLKNDDLAKFIVKEVRENGSDINGDDAKYLALNVYNDLENVVSEVLKLCSFKINEKITREDIDLLTSKNLEVRVFELVDKIGQKDAKEAINIFNNMLLVKESPLMILTMIGRTFKNLLLIKTMLDSGAIQDEIVAKTKMHPFVVKKNASTTKNFKKIELYQALFDVLEADEKIKTGQIKDTIAVENIIFKYTGGN